LIRISNKNVHVVKVVKASLAEKAYNIMTKPAVNFQLPFN